MQKHTRRQAAQHGCLSSLSADKGIEILYGEEKDILYWAELEQPSQNKNLLYRHDKPKEPIKKGRKDPFQWSSLSPHSPQFQQSEGAIPL
jgi:hypothetical protein